MLRLNLAGSVAPPLSRRSDSVNGTGFPSEKIVSNSPMSLSLVASSREIVNCVAESSRRLTSRDKASRCTGDIFSRLVSTQMVSKNSWWLTLQPSLSSPMASSLVSECTRIAIRPSPSGP